MISVDEMNASRYGSINNYQPLLSNINRSQMETNETGRYNTMTQNPNFIIDDEASTMNKADLSTDLLLSQRLDELVSEANRFRTKACGMAV